LHEAIPAVLADVVPATNRASVVANKEQGFAPKIVGHVVP